MEILEDPEPRSCISCYDSWAEASRETVENPSLTLLKSLLESNRILSIDGTKHVFCGFEVGWRAVDSYQTQDFLTRKLLLNAFLEACA